MGAGSQCDGWQCHWTLGTVKVLHQILLVTTEICRPHARRNQCPQFRSESTNMIHGMFGPCKMSIYFTLRIASPNFDQLQSQNCGELLGFTTGIWQPRDRSISVDWLYAQLMKIRDGEDM